MHNSFHRYLHPPPSRPRNGRVSMERIREIFEKCDRSPSTRAERGLHASSTLFTKLGSSGNIGFEFPLGKEGELREGCRRQIGCGPDLILKPNTGCPSISSRKDNKILLKLFLSTYQPLRLGVLSIEHNILSLSANNSACSPHNQDKDFDQIGSDLILSVPLSLLLSLETMER